MVALQARPYSNNDVTRKVKGLCFKKIYVHTVPKVSYMNLFSFMSLKIIVFIVSSKFSKFFLYVHQWEKESHLIFRPERDM